MRRYQRLNALIDRPEVMAHDPLLVKRLRRLRDDRAAVRSRRARRPELMASFRKLPQGKWQAAVWHSSGKRFTLTDPLKRVVVERANDLEPSEHRGGFVDPNAGRMTLVDRWRQWSATRLVQEATASKREQLWRVHLERAFGR